MTTASAKQTLDNVIDSIASASFEERAEIKSDEEIMDCFLDELIVFKKHLTKRANDIISIAEEMESLTWYSSPDEESLKKLYSLIVLAKETRKLMAIKYVQFNALRTQGIAKEELALYKEAMGFLKEVYIDIERAFFVFPNDKEFQHLNIRVAC